LATAGIEVVKLEAKDGRILRGWFRSFLRAGVHAEQEQSAKGEDRNACHDFDLLRSPESNRAGGAFLVFDTIARRAARPPRPR
jgi:hypothetical protein